MLGCPLRFDAPRFKKPRKRLGRLPYSPPKFDDQGNLISAPAHFELHSEQRIPRPNLRAKYHAPSFRPRLFSPSQPRYPSFKVNSRQYGPRWSRAITNRMRSPRRKSPEDEIFDNDPVPREENGGFYTRPEDYFPQDARISSSESGKPIPRDLLCEELLKENSSNVKTADQPGTTTMQQSQTLQLEDIKEKNNRKPCGTLSRGFIKDGHYHRDRLETVW